MSGQVIGRPLAREKAPIRILWVHAAGKALMSIRPFLVNAIQDVRVVFVPSCLHTVLTVVPGGADRLPCFCQCASCQSLMASIG
jgi:hypothetical protein